MDTRLIRFMIVGGASAALYFLLDWICQSRFGFKPYVATVLAYIPSFIIAYSLQRSWAFRSAASHMGTLPRYALVQLVVAILTAILTQAFVYSFPGARHVLVAGVSTITASAVSFVLTSGWVFPNTHDLFD